MFIDTAKNNIQAKEAIRCLFFYLKHRQSIKTEYLVGWYNGDATKS
jgi:hypothetical protein